VACYAGNAVSVLIGNGAGGFGPSTDFVTPPGPEGIAIADASGDGTPDLVVANLGSNSVSLYYGDGTGGFGARTEIANGVSALAVAIEDLNGDGKPDLIATNYADTFASVLLDATISSYRFANVTADHTIHADFGSILAVPTAGAVAFALGAPMPNPSAGMTRMAFTVARSAHVKLAVFDVQGRQVQVLAEGTFEPGRHEVEWDGHTTAGRAAAGLYFVRYQTPSGHFVRRVVLAR
jgi:hypothetical protein